MLHQHGRVAKAQTMAWADSLRDFHVFIYSPSLVFTGPIFRRALPRGAAFQPWCEGLWGGQKHSHGIWLSACLSRGECTVLGTGQRAALHRDVWLCWAPCCPPACCGLGLSDVRSSGLSLCPRTQRVTFSAWLCGLCRAVFVQGGAECWYLTDSSYLTDISLSLAELRDPGLEQMPWAAPGKDVCLELSVFPTAEWGQESRPRQPGGPLQREGHGWARSCPAKVSTALRARWHSAEITSDQEPEDGVDGGKSAAPVALIKVFCPVLVSWDSSSHSRVWVASVDWFGEGIWVFGKAGLPGCPWRRGREFMRKSIFGICFQTGEAASEHELFVSWLLSLSPVVWPLCAVLGEFALCWRGYTFLLL